MTRMACPECEQQISTQAAACPQCGHPLKTYAWPFGYLDQKQLASTQRVSLVSGLMLMFVMLGLYLMLISRPKESYPPPAAAAPLTPAVQ